MKKQQTKQVVSLRLDKKMIIALSVRALAEQRTVSNLIRMILEKDMDKFNFKRGKK